MWRNTARCFHSVCAKIPYRRPPAIGGEIAFCQSVQGGAGTPSGDHASIAGERRCFIDSTVYWTYERDFRAPMDSNHLMLDPSTAHLALRPSGPHARIVAAG